jgi:hypothetical protein
MEQFRHDLFATLAIAVIIGMVVFSGIQAVHAIGGEIFPRLNHSDTVKDTSEGFVVAGAGQSSTGDGRH